MKKIENKSINIMFSETKTYKSYLRFGTVISAKSAQLISIAETYRYNVYK
jgi:hypothetical protein